MTNILKVEFLKTKHSVVRLLVWLLPVIAVLMMTAVFWDNQYLVQLMMVEYVNWFTCRTQYLLSKASNEI